VEVVIVVVVVFVAVAVSVAGVPVSRSLALCGFISSTSATFIAAGVKKELSV